MKANKVIAVFESDALNRFIYQRMLTLQSEKVEFYVFESFEEGLEITRQVPFDTVFIDIHIHGIPYHGFELAKRLKAISDKSVLVGMTTLIQKGDIERAIAEGFVTCREKPLPFYDIDKLFDEIG